MGKILFTEKKSYSNSFIDQLIKLILQNRT